MKDITPMIMDNLHRSLSVEELAERCSMSPRNFARQFSATFSTTPAKFVALLRLEAAKVLLTDTTQSVEQIARKCGFTNSDVFRKSFLRTFKMTPHEYRRIWQV